MARCIRCGASFLTHRRVKLKDAELCGKCYKELGFTNYLVSDSYTYDEIKDGYDAYWIKRRKDEIKKEAIQKAQNAIIFAHYGERRDLICTEDERKMFDCICEMFKEHGLDPSGLELIRISDNYVTVKLEPWDIARLKFTNRARWVVFPSSSNTEKRRIEAPEDVKNFEDAFNETIAVLEKYGEGVIHRL